MSIDFIPIEFYTPLYYNILLVFTLVTFLHTQLLTYNNPKNRNYIKVAGSGLFIFVLCYMGLRPIHGVFVDMTTYARGFQRVQENGFSLESYKDPLYGIFLYLCTLTVTVKSFFFICALIYVVPLYVVCKKWFKQYWYYAFLLLVGSFSFWSYGVNGIRNGIATSLFLLAISRDKKSWQMIWIIIALGFHKSLLLPALGFVITWFYNKPKGFFWFWLLTIPLSLALPGFWESFFAGLVGDDRASYLTKEAEAGVFASTGFRWDFLLYSATGVVAGWYYLFKKKLKDSFYIQLFNTFLFANAFWILVIRANFSNRFAYLSWFMLAIVIIYPWLKHYFINKQHQKLGWLILAYYGFTYFMQVIYYGK